LFIPLEPGYTLIFGECGGKILFHPTGAQLPGKYHLYLEFTDGSFLTATTQMWGAMELYEQGRELERDYIKDMRPTPGESQFTQSYFNELIDELLEGKQRSVKSLLTQDQLIPGLGNASAQDIMFTAGLHPRHPLSELDGEQRAALYSVIIQTVEEITEQGGATTSMISTARKGATSAKWIKMPSSGLAQAAAVKSIKSSTWVAPATCAQVARFECTPIVSFMQQFQLGNYAGRLNELCIIKWQIPA
jgi:formamidopyrimidine-DNA glycosylase